MTAGERYFMVAVDLQIAKDRIQHILDNLKEHGLVPSIELMSACINNLTDAMVKTQRDRLSDPRFKLPCPCQGGCGNDAVHLCASCRAP